MALKIIWSKFAEMQLDEIFEYHKEKVSLKVAQNIIKGIINAPNKLILNPLIGQQEELSKGRTIEYRYLLFKNYKLIYSLDKEHNFIKIADVFDTRQSPPKLRRTK